jgi:hypothetical protein
MIHILRSLSICFIVPFLLKIFGTGFKQTKLLPINDRLACSGIFLIFEDLTWIKVSDLDFRVNPHKREGLGWSPGGLG